MSGERLVVVGGVAAGMSAASQAKRRRPQLEVIALEKGRYVSYGACGMPYNIMDPGRSIDDLVVIAPEEFRTERGIDVRLQHCVEEIDIKRREIACRWPEGSARMGFDKLVIATGCRAHVPPAARMGLDGVFVLHNLEDAARIKRYLLEPHVRRAAVVGGGHIGLEMAEVFATRGLEVSLLKRSAGLPPGYPQDMSAKVLGELQRHGVNFISPAEIQTLEGQGRVTGIVTTQGRLAAELVLFATGVEPEVELALAAGISIGKSGAIEVDRLQRTSAEGIYAAGDCCESWHRLLERGEFIPRGTTANKQGRIAGANLTGASEQFAGVLGTSITKVFGLEVGHTGLFEQQAKQICPQTRAVTITARTRAHAYPGSKEITIKLVFDGSSGKLLGAQMVGGEQVAKRLDVIAAAIQAGWTVEELAGLDASYAPPYAPVWDPILVAANQARKKG